MRIGILNLMPLKEVTECDFLRLLSATGQEVEIVWLRLRTHVPKHTSAAHMDGLYVYLDEVETLDGLIVTGAPVEQLDFEAVTYWPELCRIFQWSQTHVRSTIYICWAAQAGLYYHYGIPKYALPKKKFGIFRQQVLLPASPLFADFPDTFMMPHSRHTEIRRTDVAQCAQLSVAAESSESGVSMVFAREGREIYITGHMEYAADTLDMEYHRDKDKRDDVDLPEHYYLDDNPANGPMVTWQADAVRFYRNWLLHFFKPSDN